MILTWIWTTVSERLIGLGVVAALLATVLAWDHQRANRYRQEAVAAVVTKSNEVARERSNKVRKIRSNIKPSDALKRLQSEYGHSASASN